MWDCPTCGVKNEVSVAHCQGGCGYVKIPRQLTLRSCATGKVITMHLTTAIGRRLLAGADPKGSVYASESQFEILRDEELGAWALRGFSDARNATCLNGIQVGDGKQRLTVGDEISVSGHAKFVVSIEES